MSFPRSEERKEKVNLVPEDQLFCGYRNELQNEETGSASHSALKGWGKVSLSFPGKQSMTHLFYPRIGPLHLG